MPQIPPIPQQRHGPPPQQQSTSHWGPQHNPLTPLTRLKEHPLLPAPPSPPNDNSLLHGLCCSTWQPVESFILTAVHTCSNPNPSHSSAHTLRNTELRLLPYWVTSFSFHLSTSFSACCWHRLFSPNIIFLSSSTGRKVLFISLFLLQQAKAWRDLGHGWVVGNQSAVCGLTACRPLPLLSLPFSFSISVSLLAGNHTRLHADHILWPQMIWENMPC